MNRQLKELAETHSQFNPDSLAIRAIESVLSCTSKKAIEIVRTHCNLISFWMGIYVQGYITMQYEEFFKLLLEKGYVKESGFFVIAKDIIMKKLFNVDFNLIYYEDFEDVINPFRLNKDSLYQMKLDDPMHFIICDVDPQELTLIYDTGRRGCGVPAVGANRINNKYFKWLLEIKKR
jgi:hypothetical protein